MALETLKAAFIQFADDNGFPLELTDDADWSMTSAYNQAAVALVCTVAGGEEAAALVYTVAGEPAGRLTFPQHVYPETFVDFLDAWAQDAPLRD